MFGTIIAGVCQGLVWAVLALGVYLSFRLLDFADLSCEGTVTLGACIAATLIWKGVDPFLASVIAFVGGMIAGSVTGVLTTKLKIPPILSGILTMISCYSINIHIMSFATGVSGTANLSLSKFSSDTIYGVIKSLLGLSKNYSALIFSLVVACVIIGALYIFFGTEIGCAIRATGSNEKMCRAQGINTDTTKILGLALSNGMIALAGSMLCQYQTFSDVNMGVGAIVIGLASIIIGETIFMKAKNFALKLLGIVVGSVIYRVVVSLVIYSGMPSTDLKLMTAVIVMVALSLPMIRGAFVKKKKATPAVKAGAQETAVEKEENAEVSENV